MRSRSRASPKPGHALEKVAPRRSAGGEGMGMASGAPPRCITRSRPIWCSPSRRCNLPAHAPRTMPCPGPSASKCRSCHPGISQSRAVPELARPRIMPPVRQAGFRRACQARRRCSGLSGRSCCPGSSPPGNFTGALPPVPACPDDRLRPVGGASAVAKARPRPLPHPHASASARSAGLARPRLGLSQACSHGTPRLSNDAVPGRCRDGSERRISIYRILELG